MLRILALVAGLLAASIALVVCIGYALPVKHVAARALSLRQKPADVFALISSFKDAATWRPEVKQVEMLSALPELPRFQEKTAGATLTMQVVESIPPQRLVTRIDDPGLPFGGRWIYEVSSTSEGSRLNITERGEIYNPVFRFVSRFILGYHGTLDAYLNNVARKFGENTAPQEGAPADH